MLILFFRNIITVTQGCFPSRFLAFSLSLCVVYSFRTWAIRALHNVLWCFTYFCLFGSLSYHPFNHTLSVYYFRFSLFSIVFRVHHECWIFQAFFSHSTNDIYLSKSDCEVLRQAKLNMNRRLFLLWVNFIKKYEMRTGEVLDVGFLLLTCLLPTRCRRCYRSLTFTKVSNEPMYVFSCGIDLMFCYLGNLYNLFLIP